MELSPWIWFSSDTLWCGYSNKYLSIKKHQNVKKIYNSIISKIIRNCQCTFLHVKSSSPVKSLCTHSQYILWLSNNFLYHLDGYEWVHASITHDMAFIYSHLLMSYHVLFIINCCKAVHLIPLGIYKEPAGSVWQTEGQTDRWTARGNAYRHFQCTCKLIQKKGDLQWHIPGDACLRWLTITEMILAVTEFSFWFHECVFLGVQFYPEVSVDRYCDVASVTLNNSLRPSDAYMRL